MPLQNGVQDTEWDVVGTNLIWSTWMYLAGQRENLERVAKGTAQSSSWLLEAAFDTQQCGHMPAGFTSQPLAVPSLMRWVNCCSHRLAGWRGPCQRCSSCWAAGRAEGRQKQCLYTWADFKQAPRWRSDLFEKAPTLGWTKGICSATIQGLL